MGTRPNYTHAHTKPHIYTYTTHTTNTHMPTALRHTHVRTHTPLHKYSHTNHPHTYTQNPMDPKLLSKRTHTHTQSLTHIAAHTHTRESITGWHLSVRHSGGLNTLQPSGGPRGWRWLVTRPALPDMGHVYPLLLHLQDDPPTRCHSPFRWPDGPSGLFPNSLTLLSFNPSLIG